MVLKTDFGKIGMALSCTLFLEAALKKYKKYAASVDEDSIKVINEWNRIIISLLNDSSYRPMLGRIGNKLIDHKQLCKNFAQKCVDDAPDVSAQSLHYALRFNENVRFLKNKYDVDSELKFVDLGCGLSPLSAVIQTKYNLENVYCIDTVPEIVDLCAKASCKLNGKEPQFITWDQAQKMSGKNGINTIVSVGVLPHMPLKMQKEYMEQINKKFDNFFLEIKYKKKNDIKNSDNAFSIQELQNLRIGVENVSDIETVAIRNCLNYISKFVHAKPNRRDFLANQSRSLFLSR